MATLQAGFGSAQITPSIGTPLGGYLGRPQFEAKGIHDPLFVKVMALQSAGEPPVLVFALDLLGLTPERSRDLAGKLAVACGQQLEQIVLACSHTHSGPNTLSLRGMPEVGEEYYDYLLARMMQAAGTALASMCPVRLTVGTAGSRVGVNRRAPAQEAINLQENPDGVYDDYLLAIRFLDEDGDHTLGVVTSYGCHLTALGGRNMLISAEWAGLAMSKLQEELGGVPCLFLNGAFGNVNPRGRDETWEKTLELAAEYARDCLRALDAAGPEPATPLRLTRREVELPLTPLPSEEEVRTLLEEARAIAEANAENPAGGRLLEVRSTFARDVAERRRRKDALASVKAELIGLRIGSVALVGVPGEIFAEYGLRLRECSPFQYTMVLGNVGSEMGYFPTAAAFTEGGYEPSSYVYFTEQGYSKGIETVLMDGARSILDELACP